jgi:hypothetical protein
MSSYYEDGIRHECSESDCDRDASEFLMVRSWTGDTYGRVTEGGNVMPITTGYYCRDHMADYLRSLVDRYRGNTIK